MKKILAVMLAMVFVAAVLTACAKDDAAAVKVYTVEEKFNSSTVNQWKTLYLLDEDNYALTVYALDSQDPERVTADFYMAGKYITNEDGSVTIQPGYGYAKVMNGEEPLEIAVTPDESGTMGNMYLTMIGQFTTYQLNADGTWEGIGN